MGVCNTSVSITRAGLGREIEKEVELCKRNGRGWVGYHGSWTVGEAMSNVVGRWRVELVPE